MAANLQAWQAYVGQRTAEYVKQFVPAVFVDFGYPG